MTTPTEDGLPSCGGSHCIFARVRLKLFLRYVKPILRRKNPYKIIKSRTFGKSALFTSYLSTNNINFTICHVWSVVGYTTSVLCLQAI